jgi:hypothetical protein
VELYATNPIRLICIALTRETFTFALTAKYLRVVLHFALLVDGGFCIGSWEERREAI